MSPTTDERERWAAYKSGLPERVSRGEMTATQARLAVETWQRIGAVNPDMPLPVAGMTADGNLYFEWAPRALPLTLLVEFLPNGRVEWFFRDGIAGSVLGTEDESEEALPSLVFLLARAFGAMPEPLSPAEANRQVLERLKTMTFEDIFALSVETGIHRPDGSLTSEYGGEGGNESVTNNPVAQQACLEKP